ncbi:MAG TPA: arsenate reductase (glutaredoxin) [Rhodocyclaceae bacterium]|jgi:arsenate reductase|nr:arsenate reductase (glutaredoxin) [Rhodocyclaceae bacterium]
MKVTIFHNPGCSNSRGALDILRAAGIEPTIIEYLHTPPSAIELKRLLSAMQMPARDLLREKEAEYAVLGLGDAKWTEAELIDFMAAHPVLINRPIVEAAKGVRLCRPPEIVHEII